MTELMIAPVAALAEQAAHVEMQPEGWLFMAAAWIFILSLTFYTFSKVLRKK
jgi:hypothetical protein